MANIGKTRAGDSRDALAVLALMLLSVVPYLNSLTGSFVYDDRLQVAGNPYVHSFRYLGKIFGSTVWMWEGAQGVTNYYRPLMSFAYLVCYKLFGQIPLGYHLLNVVLHVGVVVVLFFVTERMFGDRLLSLTAAGLFALHPVHTESVAWIAGVTDLELSFFFLLTFLFYLRLDRSSAVADSDAANPSSSANPWLLYAGMTVSYVLALLSKEQALVLPALAIVYEHFYRSGHSAAPLRAKAARYAPLCVAAVAYLVFRHFALGTFAPFSARPTFPWSAVALSALSLIGSYLWKLIWPAHLSAFYVFHESTGITDPRVLGGVAAVIICVAVFFWLWRRSHTLSFSLLWMAATIAPVLNARWMPAQVFAERYLYLPSAGFCWLIAAAAVRIWHGAPGHASPQSIFMRRAIPIALAAIAVVYGVQIFHRNRDWHSEQTLYTKTLQQYPDAQLIRTNLGVLAFDRGNRDEAERQWNIALGPGLPPPAALNDMGLVREYQKRYPEAIDFFNRALARQPKFVDPHINLADTYIAMGRPEDAEAEFRIAVSLAPLSTRARNDYGQFLLDHGRTAEAQQQFALSAEADDNGDADDNLGDILLGESRLDEARAAYQAAVALNPFDNRAYFGLGRLDEQNGRVAEAIREYRQGLETDPNNTAALVAIHRLAEQRDLR